MLICTQVHEVLHETLSIENHKRFAHQAKQCSYP